MSSEPRDLLAERIRRLEKQVGELTGLAADTRGDLTRAMGQLDELVTLVGRLGRVVDVQGNTLTGDETHLEGKLDNVEAQISALRDGFHSVEVRLADLRTTVDKALGGRRTSRK